MTFEIRPLSDALGAEVLGGNFKAALAVGEIDELKSAFLRYHLLCVRSEPLSPQAFFQVASYFGTPFVETTRMNWVGDVPEISRLESTYKTPEAKPKDPKFSRLSGWHTDHSFKESPPKATLLHSHEIPSEAGQTRFCNTRKAYDNLPEATKQQLEGLLAIHSYDTERAPARAVARTAEEIAETPDVIHPLVCTHDETGNKALYFNSNRTDRVVGLERAESDQLLDAIHERMIQPQYRYDHDWSVGDILVWDNRYLIHSVNVDYPVGEPRIHLRTLIKGTRPE
jgi:taurine dioxygenase